MIRALLLALAVVLPFQTPDQALDKEWNAALAFKQQSLWREGAAAFEGFAKLHPESPRAPTALVEAGVCWIGLAKSQQELRRNTEASTKTFLAAGALFQRVVSEKPDDPVAARAQYLVGQTALYLDDPQAAQAAYDTGVQKYKADPKYAAKCLERRAASRRALLDSAGALRDLQSYVQSYPKGEELELVRRALRFTQGLDRPAPAWKAEHWALSEPLAPEAMRGEVVVVCFLASWCEKCARERAFVLELKRRYEPLGVRFVGVVQPWQEHDGKTRHSLESFTVFAASSGYAMPLLLDSGGGPGATAAGFGCEALPDMAIVDRAGRVRWHDHPANLLDTTLNRLLEEEH